MSVQAGLSEALVRHLMSRFSAMFEDAVDDQHKDCGDQNACEDTHCIELPSA
ncbi:hypothetical protein GA0061105_12212 [Rhizobium aethiopicum]|uniref:Uncharacterized protein n=1 Tax=Rhizobium aethiopicum TaxID=1138170 RepID=A0A1C3YB80_9HYPH|nr:hypothetical protein GA0061105_12212 [Rhizobium aethiopicum]